MKKFFNETDFAQAFDKQNKATTAYSCVICDCSNVEIEDTKHYGSCMEVATQCCECGNLMVRTFKLSAMEVKAETCTPSSIEMSLLPIETPQGSNWRLIYDTIKGMEGEVPLGVKRSFYNLGTKDEEVYVNSKGIVGWIVRHLQESKVNTLNLDFQHSQSVTSKVAPFVQLTIKDKVDDCLMTVSFVFKITQHEVEVEDMLIEAET